MNEEQNNLSDTQADDTQLMSAAVNENVIDVPIDNNDGQTALKEEGTLTVAELNALLGKNFKDKATALKSIKETQSFVGVRKQEIAKEVLKDNENIAKELKDLKTNLFFKENPQYKEYRPLIEKLGTNPETVVTSSDFKTVFEKAARFDENQSLKTVLETNSRTAQIRDKFKDADALRAQGRKEEAGELLVNELLKSL